MAFSVLIVEDEEILSSSLQEFLEEFDLEADTAASGEEAISKLGKKEYNAAIVDLGLPDINGDDLIIKAHKIKPNVSYYIYTGDPLYEPTEELLHIGLDKEHLIFKPVFDLMVIYNKIYGDNNPD